MMCSKAGKLVASSMGIILYVERLDFLWLKFSQACVVNGYYIIVLTMHLLSLYVCIVSQLSLLFIILYANSHKIFVFYPQTRKKYSLQKTIHRRTISICNKKLQTVFQGTVVVCVASILYS